MNFHRAGIRVTLLALALSLGLVFWGCGEKIALPEATGDFNINKYTILDTLGFAGTPVQVTNGWSYLYVLTVDSLFKYDAGLNLDEQVGGLAGPKALCADTEADLLFIWEDDTKRVTWFDFSTLEVRGSSVLPDVATVSAMTTNRAGIQLAGARSFLYLTDPVSRVVHRYAFDLATGLTPFGLLTSPEGAGTRFAHDPAGLTTDGEGYVLVCEADTSRNWVIRFNGTPDTTDVAIVPGDPDPLRGLAALFFVATCEPTPAAADYVLGDAAECEESDWQGGPSSADGEFARPSDVAVDLSGRIFVADTDNRRVQLFTPEGEFITYFSTVDLDSVPTSLAVINGETNEGEIIFGAYVVLTLRGDNRIFRFISKEYDDIINRDEYSD